jgi:glycosyltransferase involved in cell wall biosynthesis
MEAMAQGLAVVGSRVGGIKTLIQDKVNGLLVNPQDSAMLAEAIITLLKDSRMRRDLGLNARKFIMGNFSNEKMVEGTELIYKHCLKDG